MYLFSPTEAKAEALGSLPATGLNTTTIYSTTSTYASLNTVETVNAAITAASGTGTKAAASNGGVYVFKLSTGAVGVLQITALSGTGRASQISIKWQSNA